MTPMLQLRSTSSRASRRRWFANENLQGKYREVIEQNLKYVKKIEKLGANAPVQDASTKRAIDKQAKIERVG
jgi:hypothetical protein